MFAFSKIRACESIFETKGATAFHGPGWGTILCCYLGKRPGPNIVNPYFPFVGYAYGNKSALNFVHDSSRFINEEMETDTKFHYWRRFGYLEWRRR